MGLPERQQAAQFPNPLTGEVVDRNDVDQLAALLEQLRAHQRRVRSFTNEVQEMIVELARVAGTKTIHLQGGRKAVVAGGPEVEWDVPTLMEGLLEAGLPQERLNELVTIEQTYKVNANVAKSIAGSNPDYARVIDEAKSTVDKPERVRISG